MSKNEFIATLLLLNWVRAKHFEHSPVFRVKDIQACISIQIKSNNTVIVYKRNKIYPNTSFETVIGMIENNELC